MNKPPERLSVKRSETLFERAARLLEDSRSVLARLLIMTGGPVEKTIADFLDDLGRTARELRELPPEPPETPGFREWCQANKTVMPVTNYVPGRGMRGDKK